MMQIWRMIDLIYRPEDEVLGELDKHRSQQSFDKENNQIKLLKDKATVEMECMEEGYLAKIICGDGSKEIKVGEVLNSS